MRPVARVQALLTAMVVQDLVEMAPEEFARQLQVFAGDIRRLATLTPASG